MAPIARKLLTALALAGTAAAFLEEYVTVTHVKEVIFPGKINVNAVNGVMVAAAVTDAEISACATADAVLSICVASGYLDDGAPTATAKSCLCCYQGLTLKDEYSSCSTYLSASFPTETAAFTTISMLNEICATGTCAAAATPTRTSGTATAIPPAACTSFVSVYQSCTSKVTGWSTIGGSRMADCLWYVSRNFANNDPVRLIASSYDLLGKYNTKFDDYASSCAPFAKTAVPSEYSGTLTLPCFAAECVAYIVNQSSLPWETSARTSPRARLPEERVDSMVLVPNLRQLLSPPASFPR